MILKSKNKLWKKSILRKSSTIKDAINSLVSSSTRICMIINDKNKLLGVLNDGDIRRAIVKGYEMSAKVSEIMNTEPKILTYPIKPSEIKKIRKLDIHQIPIVNAKKILIGLYGDHLDEIKKKSNVVVIMSGGLGKRLKPFTNNVPKALVKINNREMLGIVIDKFNSYGFETFFFMLQHKSNQIISYINRKFNKKLNYKFFKEIKPLGTAGSLKLLNGIVKKSFLLINCDVISDLDYVEFLNFHKKTNSDITIAVKEIESRSDFGVIDAKGTRVYDINEKPVKKVSINGGIYALKPNILKLIKENENLDMISLIKRALIKKYKINKYPIYEKWIDVGTPIALKIARKNV